MIELRPTPIILISFYCFLLGLFFFSLTANTIFGDNGIVSSTDFVAWLPVVAFVAFAAALIIDGIGILYFNQLSWKFLFFFLMIGVSTIASLIFVVLVFLMIGAGILNTFYQSLHVSSVAWYSFLAFFLSGIIVLYYLTRKDIMSLFGEMGSGLLNPF